MKAHFPARFGGADAEALLYHQQQQNRLLAVCGWVATQQPRQLELLATIDEWLLGQVQPEIFDEGDSRNVLVEGRRRFGSLCAALAEQGYARPHELVEFDFHSAVQFLTEKHQAA